MKKLLFVLLTSVSFLTANAAGPQPTTFKIDAAKSTFKWTGKKVAGEHWGYVKFSNGMLNVNNGALTSGSATVDMNSINCQDLQGEWADKLVGHLKADDFFGTDKYPTSTINIKSVTPKGNNQYDVKADLTIKGITNEVTFPATASVNGTMLTANASFKVDRTKYGIKYGSGNFFENLGDKAIDNNFSVEINLVANADAPAAAPAKATATKKTAKKSTKKATTAKAKN